MFAALVDLPGSVEIARALGARVPPAAPAEKREEATALRERLHGRITTIARSVSDARLSSLPGVPHLSPASILASLRVAGAIEDEEGLGNLGDRGRALDRVVRALWSPFTAALARRAARAQAELDAVFTEEAGALASLSGRPAYVLAFDALLDKVTDTGAAPVIDRVGDLLARRFRTRLADALAALPERPAHADVAPWIEPGGFLELQLARGEALLRGLVEHRVTRAHAIVDACCAVEE